MKRIHLVAASIAIAAVSSLTVGRPGNTQGFWQQFSSIKDVGARQSDISKRITDAVAAGRLNAQQSNTYKAELKRIADLETSYKADGKLSIWETVRLGYQLDQLSKELETHLGERTVALTDVDGRRRQIDAQIAEGLSAGRLTARQASDFRLELDGLARKTAEFRRDGTLTTTEQLTLSHDLDHLGTNIEMAMRDRQFAEPDVDVKQAQLERRINQAVRSGQIDSREGEQLRQELNRIATMKANYSSSGRGLNAEEKLSVAIELERLSARIERYVPTAVSDLPGIDAKQEAIAKKILDAESAGELTSKALNELEYEFDRIGQVEKTYRADGNLSDAETLALARDLDNLSARVDQSVRAAAGPGPGPGYGPGPEYGQGPGPGYGQGPGPGYGQGPGPGPRPGRAVRVLKAEVQKMILDGLASGRLPVQAGGELNRELDRIAARESEFRSDGALSDSEFVELTTDLEALRVRVGQDLSPLPNVEGRRAEIVAKIDSRLASGRLSAQAASELRQDLDRVASLEATFKSSEGRLDDQELSTLDREYALVQSHLDRSESPLPDVAGLKAQIESKLGDATASGKIPSHQATDFHQELDRIASVEQSFRTSDNGLNDWETVALSRDLDRLNQAVDRAVASAQTTTQVQVPPVAQVQGPVAPDTRGHWAEPYVAMLSGRNIIGGFPDGTFRPNDDITRAQFAAIAVKALNVPPAEAGRNFTDVPERHWAARAIAAVSNAGLVTGFPEGTFRPEDKITRAQALVILAKALPRAQDDTKALDSYSDAQAVPGWANRAVAAAANAHIIVNYPDPAQVRPNALATRAEVASLIYQTMVNKGSDLPALKIGVLDLSH